MLRSLFMPPLSCIIVGEGGDGGGGVRGSSAWPGGRGVISGKIPRASIPPRQFNNG